MVEAIETLFEPVVIYNNQPGKDAQTLKRFKEPSWNYQVVRFLDGDSEDIIPRKDKVWTTEPLAKRMIQALQKQQREVPKFLIALAGKSVSNNHGTAAFAMYCFWTGEMQLGALPGVLTTEAGWLDGNEVTLVEFDRDTIPFSELVKKAASLDCAKKVYTNNPADHKIVQESRLISGTLNQTYRSASRSDQKRQIRNTTLSKLNLNPVQATKLNAFARSNPSKALSWLSPNQVKQLQMK